MYKRQPQGSTIKILVSTGPENEQIPVPNVIDKNIEAAKSELVAAGLQAVSYTHLDVYKRQGYAMTPPPVKVLALAHNLPVYQPTTLRTQEAAQQIREMQPECIVVVAYGKILPKEILEIPPYGCINVHASLLPKYRGAAPIQWSRCV